MNPMPITINRMRKTEIEIKGNIHDNPELLSRSGEK